MEKVEQLLIAVVVAGFAASLMLVPGSKWVLIIGIGFLANIYLFDLGSVIKNLSFSDYNKKSMLPKTFKLHNMLPGYAIVSVMMGMLFKFKTWPGGNTILSIGFAVSIFAVYILRKNMAKDSVFANGAIKRILIYSVFGVVFYILPEYFWLEKTYRNFPEYVQARKNFDQDPENETLKSMMEEAYEQTKYMRYFR
jgi:heat shock protein HspQ